MTAISFGQKYVQPMWNFAKHAPRNYANFVFGVEQSEIFSSELSKSVRGVKDKATKKYVGGTGFKNFGNKISSAWAKSKKAVEGKSLWKVITDSFKKVPNEFAAAKRLAKMTGKNSKLWGGTLKIIGKRMPLIGNLLFVAMEIPNIFSAFKNGGIGTGLVETGKAAGKFGGFAAGAAIGACLGPVGAIVGGIIGGIVADKILGKSFTEKQGEAKLASTGTAHIQEQAQIAPAQMQAQIANSQTAVQDSTRVANPNADMTQELLKMAGGGQAAAPQNNPFAQGQYATNPFMTQQNFMDEDFMAMNAGLTKRG